MNAAQSLPKFLPISATDAEPDPRILDKLERVRPQGRPTDPSASLARLAKVYEQGFMTEEQFEKAKKQLFDPFSTLTPLKFKPDKLNLRTILEQDSRMKGRFRKNDFTNQYSIVPLYGPQRERELKDSDIKLIEDFLQRCYSMGPKTTDISSQVELLASLPSNTYHPLQDWLITCYRQWDKKPRIDGWLIEYLNAPTEAEGQDISRLLKEVGTKWLLACVKRAFEPGSKFDNVLILKGSQGSYKSTALSILGGEWFSDTPLNLQSKDAMMALQGVWIYEFAELDSMDRTTQNRVKAFLSSSTDRFRGAYERFTTNQKRTTVFCGTTNLQEFLKDETGNRRHWVIETGDIDIDSLRRDVMHIWGEAFSLMMEHHDNHYTVKRDVQLWMSKEDEQAYENLRRRYVETDVWEDTVREFMGETGGKSITEILNKLGGNTGYGTPTQTIKFSRTDRYRVRGILMKLGFKETRSSGKRLWSK